MPGGYFISIIRYSRMKRRKQLFKDYLRKKRHVLYVEKRVVELRGEICQQAVLYGTVDISIRELYLKYNEYLVFLNSNT